MGVPISIRLDDEVRATLEREAAEAGVGLSTYLRDAMTRLARERMRERARRSSREVGLYVASSPEARAFYEDWGSGGADYGDR